MRSQLGCFVVTILLVVGVALRAGTATASAPALGHARLSAVTTLWTVTSRADSGPGTLRQALLDAQAGDAVSFASSIFPPALAQTITLSSPLPAIIQDALILDASDAGVILDGHAAGGGAIHGIDLRASGVTVRGLQIVGFSGCGVAVRGADNVIGGERQNGAGMLGQGNLVSGNGVCGIGLWDNSTAYNRIAGNLIGVDASGLRAWGNASDGIHINGANHNLFEDNVISGNGNGIQACCNTDSSYNVLRNNLIGVGSDGQEPIPNGMAGVWLHDGARYNVVGPDNVIAHNEQGVQIDSAASSGNTITRNRIYANGAGIVLTDGGNDGLAPPYLMEYDAAAGFAAGFTCSGCTVALFSDQADQGETFEAAVNADAAGYFSLQAPKAFVGPHLTATATDASGNTSEFSAPVAGVVRLPPLQTGNTQPSQLFQALPSPQLADNGLSLIFHDFWHMTGVAHLVDTEIAPLGAKLVRASINEADAALIDWSRPETVIEVAHDQFFTDCVASGVDIMYILQFWDKAWHEAGHTVPIPRFQTQEEIDRYLGFVDFIVGHFRDRVNQYELWNEPTSEGTYMTVLVDDYINLANQAIPRIKWLDPGAQVAVGSVSGMDAPHLRSFLYTLIENQALMASADIVTWHPFFGASPGAEQYAAYYAAYPELVQDIVATARAHGFAGAFRADEMVYRSPDCPWCAAGDPLYSDLSAAKYYARGIVMHAGLGVRPGVAGMSSLRTQSFTAVRNLDTLLAGAQPQTFPFALTTPVTNVLSYAFALPQGETLIAYWDHGPASDTYCTTEVTLRLPGAAGSGATAIDVLYGYSRALAVNIDGADLVIAQLLLGDYPRFVLITPVHSTYLPLVGR